MPTIIQAAKMLVMSFVKTQPLVVYLTASMYAWVSEVQQAARLAVSTGIGTDYAPEMNNAYASSYHALLELQHRYIVAI